MSVGTGLQWPGEMPGLNEKVAQAFQELADLIQIAGGDRFKIVAYRRVADEVLALGRDISGLSPEEISGLRGVGKASAAKIQEVLATGTMARLEHARAAVPAGVREMTRLPGLGPRTALLLHDELGISSLEELTTAIKQGRLEGIKGMGRKTIENLAGALSSFQAGRQRTPLDVALQEAETLVNQLRTVPAVEQAAYCGSLRRMQQTIGDLDLLVSSSDPHSVIDAFAGLAGDAIGAKGATRGSMRTAGGQQVDLRVVVPEQFGSALQYFSGSKEHNVRIREIAVRQGYRLSEYGLFRLSDNQCVASRTEEEIYSALGMQTPPPTLRQDRGEVEAALKGTLPAVVTLGDIKGDLHSHTTYSDGSASVREMALAALAQGREYLAVTDHLDAWVKSHSIESLMDQAAQIARVNRELEGRFTVLQGVEVDIDPEGNLALPDEVLDAVDLVIASIHRRFGLAPREQTLRVIKAICHPRVDILGHPTGRWLGKREPVQFDAEAVFRAAADNNVALEVNSNPARLDLTDHHLRLAKQFGCRFTINTDSHSPGHLARMRLGVGTAQRGWVTAAEVINCLPVQDLLPTFSGR